MGRDRGGDSLTAKLSIMRPASCPTTAGGGRTARSMRTTVWTMDEYQSDEVVRLAMEQRGLDGRN
jgi:hypothetical protein